MGNCKTICHLIIGVALLWIQGALAIEGASQGGGSSYYQGPLLKSNQDASKGKGLCSHTVGDKTSMIYLTPRSFNGSTKYDMTVVLRQSKPKLQTDRKMYSGFDCFSRKAGERQAYFCKGLLQGSNQVLLSVVKGSEGFQIVWKTRDSEDEEFNTRDWGSGFDCNLDAVFAKPEDSQQPAVVGSEEMPQDVPATLTPNKTTTKVETVEPAEVEQEQTHKPEKLTGTPPEVVYWNPSMDEKKRTSTDAINELGEILGYKKPGAKVKDPKPYHSSSSPSARGRKRVNPIRTDESEVDSVSTGNQ